jgi:UDP-N-acetylglucosamine acyltransferase
MVGGQAAIKRDVPPFVTIDGHTNCVVGLNVVGLRRHGFTADDIVQLKSAYRVIYRGGLTWTEVRTQLAAKFTSGRAADFAEFFAVGKRGFVQERATPRRAIVPGPDLSAEEHSDLSVLRAS